MRMRVCTEAQRRKCFYVATTDLWAVYLCHRYVSRHIVRCSISNSLPADCVLCSLMLFVRYPRISTGNDGTICWNFRRLLSNPYKLSIHCHCCVWFDFYNVCLSILFLRVLTPCWFGRRYQRFGMIYCLHLQGWRWRENVYLKDICPQDCHNPEENIVFLVAILTSEHTNVWYIVKFFNDRVPMRTRSKRMTLLYEKTITTWIRLFETLFHKCEF